MAKKILSMISIFILCVSIFGSYLNVAVLGDVRSLNPFLVKSSAERIVVGYLYETLLGEQNGKIVGILASDWAVDFSSNSLTFKIADRKFHDGKVVTADDVVFSFKYILEKKLPLGPILAYLVGAEKIDEKTVKLTFRMMNTSMLSFAPMAIPIIPKEIWENIQNPMEFPNIEKPIGSGPLAFEKLSPQTVTLRFFKDHPNASEKLDGVILHTVQDETMGFLGLVKGDYDYLYWDLDPALAKQVLDNPSKYPNLRIALTDGGSVNVILFNHRKGPMDDVNFRKAILYAINYKEIIDKVYMNFAQPASIGLLPRSLKELYLDSVGVVSQNVQLAKQFLSSSKYGKETLKVLVSTSKQDMEMAEYIRMYLKNLGINVEIDAQGPEGLTTKLKKADFDLALYSYNLGSHPEMIFYHLHSSRGTMKDGQVTGFNYGGINIKELDTALESIWMAFGDEERVQAFKNLQKLLGEIVPVVPLLIPANVEAYSIKNFTGWVVSESEGVMNTETLKNLTPVK
ncbi:MAG: ABC transporter substrate-binding protein [Pseudothermotoga sp.]